MAETDPVQTVQTVLNAAREALSADHPDRAIAQLVALLTTHANDANVLQQAGVLLAGAQRHDAALPFFRQSLLANPYFARGHFNLGLAVRALGDIVEAERELRTAMQLAPDAPEPCIELADLLGHRGNVADALALLDAHATRFVGSDRFHAARAHVLKRDGRLREAADSLQRAIDLSPRSIAYRCNLALILNDLGRADEACSTLAPMLAAKPSASVRLRTAVLLPGILGSIEQIARSRELLESTLDDLLRTDERVPDPIGSLNSIPFYLAYAGLNDRPILEKLAAVHRRICPSLTFTAPHVNQRKALRGRIIRLGIISTNLFSHTIGRLNVGLIEHIDRSRFETFVLDNQVDDVMAAHIRASVDHVIRAPRSFAAARQAIADAELDVIFYPDIGMVPLTYYLAFARLAPLQCVTWGHPLTTGLDSVDYFLSATDLETDGSSSHYAERLHCLSVPGTCYARPHLKLIDDDDAAARRHFGFSPDWHLYVCPQSLFKIHPQFDAILSKILREDRAARIVLVTGNHAGMFDALKQRFVQTMGGDVERVILLPKLTVEEFVSLLSIADANLDTIHFCGGNTSLEAFAVGCPIVTWPSLMLRGRITYALYRQMGLDDCIVHDADQYVRTALRLANDRAWHDEQRRSILAKNEVLFDNHNVIREFENFFTTALSQAM